MEIGADQVESEFGQPTSMRESLICVPNPKAIQPTADMLFVTLTDTIACVSLVRTVSPKTVSSWDEPWMA
jgi:hypothetical protein